MEMMRYPLEKGYLSRQYKLIDPKPGKEKTELLDEMQEVLNKVFEESRENRKATGPEMTVCFEDLESVAADMLMQHFYNLVGEAAAAGEQAGKAGTLGAEVIYHADGTKEIQTRR